MHTECFGIAGNDKTESSRILTEIFVNMSIMMNNVSVCTRTCTDECLIFVPLLIF